MKTCKHCLIQKEHIAFIDEKGKSRAKDGGGLLWMGKVCYDCYKAIQRLRYEAKVVEVKQCPVCQLSFTPKVKARHCSEICRQKARRLA